MPSPQKPTGFNIETLSASRRISLNRVSVTPSVATAHEFSPRRSVAMVRNATASHTKTFLASRLDHELRRNLLPTGFGGLCSASTSGRSATRCCARPESGPSAR